MIPRLVFVGSERRKTAHSAWPLFAAALAIGMIFMGGFRLSAQDVPPPPPDAQSSQPEPDQQQAPDPMGEQPYGGDVQQQQGAPPLQQGQPGQDQPGPEGQPLPPQQLEQMVAPIALYPDALVAQILAAATYPEQVVEADQWRQQMGNASPDQIAQAANTQQWDPSVKALTAFPSVLSQMDRNMQWTSDLGNAYYNQPQDVMDAVQRMRQRAQAAGSLGDTQQQTVSEDDGGIAIEPASPDVVYVPVYDPWVVYGTPVAVFPGYYYAPPPGVFFGVGFGYRIGFGVGIPLRPWAPWGWGWHNWGCGWGNRTIVYDRTTYITRSTTVINRGFNRPGGPPIQLAGRRGSFVNHPEYAGYVNHVTSGARPAGNGFANRPVYNNSGFGHPGVNNPGNVNHSGAQPSFNSGARQTYQPRTNYQPGATYNRPNPGATQYRSAPTQNYNHPAQTYRPQVQSQPHFSQPSAPRMAPMPHAAPAPHPSGGGGHPR